jgi:hypothetical protein
MSCLRFAMFIPSPSKQMLGLVPQVGHDILFVRHFLIHYFNYQHAIRRCAVPDNHAIRRCAVPDNHSVVECKEVSTFKFLRLIFRR